MKLNFGLSQNDGKHPVVFCKHITHLSVNTSWGNCSLLFAEREWGYNSNPLISQPRRHMLEARERGKWDRPSTSLTWSFKICTAVYCRNDVTLQLFLMHKHVFGGKFAWWWKSIVIAILIFIKEKVS